MSETPQPHLPNRPRRRRPSRRRLIIRRWIALGVLLLVAGLTYLLFFTSVLGVRAIQVSGTRDLTQEQILTTAAVQQGSPMLTINLAQIRDRVAALPRVAAVDVFRAWPSTVRIAVTERTPIAVFKVPTGTHLVDGTGKDYATVAVTPNGLPELKLSKVDQNDPTTKAAMAALTALPDKVKADVLTVSAASASSVVLALTDNREVRWGAAEDSAVKAAKLAILLTQKGRIYDVSSPDMPTIS